MCIMQRVASHITISLLTSVIAFALSLSDVRATQLQSESSSLFRVQVDGKYGFINSAGQIVINPQYDEATWFSEGLAGVKINGKWGFIDEAGRIVIQPQFDGVIDFYEGLASV